MRLLLPALLLAACTAEAPQVISVTLLEDTRDATGPYVVQVEVRGALGDHDVVLCWSVGGGELHPEPTEARDGRADLRFAAIPGQAAGSTVEFIVVVVDAPGCPTLGAGDTLRSFRVLPSSLACVVDSDCVLGAEICVDDGTCRAFSGTCEDGECPGGFACDDAREPPACVIPARPCAGDLECPSAEECDPARDACVARPACSETLACPGDHMCNTVTGLCFRP